MIDNTTLILKRLSWCLRNGEPVYLETKSGTKVGWTILDKLEVLKDHAVLWSRGTGTTLYFDEPYYKIYTLTQYYNTYYNK